MLKNKYLSFKYKIPPRLVMGIPNYLSTVPLDTLITTARESPTQFLQNICVSDTLRLSIVNDGNPNKIIVPQDGSFIWVSGIVGPCLFISLASVNDQGYYDKAVYGHFSAISSQFEYKRFCEALTDQNPNLNLDIRLAGYAGRTTKDTLCDSVIKLCKALEGHGINLDYEFQGQRAVLIQRVDRKAVSDLGLDIGLKRKFGRTILWGISRDVNILFSFVYQKVPSNVKLVTIIS